MQTTPWSRPLVQQALHLLPGETESLADLSLGHVLLVIESRDLDKKSVVVSGTNHRTGLASVEPMFDAILLHCTVDRNLVSILTELKAITTWFERLLIYEGLLDTKRSLMLRCSHQDWLIWRLGGETLLRFVIFRNEIEKPLSCRIT